MPHFAASDLVMHCLLLSHKNEDRLIWVNGFILRVGYNKLGTV